MTTFDSDPNYTITNNKLCFSHSFNKPLKPFHKIMRQTNHLVLGNNFNQKLNLTPNITILTLGNNYNQKFKIKPYTTSITFGNNFNQPVHLTPCVKTLIFGQNFNQPIVLTHAPCIETLIFGQDFNHPIVLTPCIQTLTFGNDFNHDIELVPSITHITFGQHFNYTIFEYTKNIVSLEYERAFDQPYLLPKNLSYYCAKVWYDDDYPILNKNMKSLHVGFVSTELIKTNKCLTYAKIACLGDTTCVLNKKITHFDTYRCSMDKGLPKHLSILSIHISDGKHYIIPTINLVNLSLFYNETHDHDVVLDNVNKNTELIMVIKRGSHKIIDNIPNGVSTLTLEYCETTFDNIPNSVEKFTSY